MPISEAILGVALSETREQALARLAAGCARKGYSIAYDLLRDSGEAEDAVQESLARACAGYAGLRDPAALEGWFYRVLTNYCMRTLRRKRVYGAVRRIWAGDSVVRQGGEDGEESEIDIVAEDHPVDDTLIRAGDVKRTLGAVEKLPVMQRTALLLRYGHDLSVGQIAEMLDVGEGTVKTHLVRGLARLRELVGSGGGKS